MLVLVLDTSSAATTAALAEVDDSDTITITIVASRINVDARAHGEVLAPAIKSCLGEVAARAGDLDAVVAGVGPGPYTGLRVGLVTAAALADGLAIPAYGVCSLDGIAGAVSSPRLLVAGDARRREVYWAGYQDGQRNEGPDVAKPAALDTSKFSACAGAGARLYAEVLGLPILDQDYPDAAALTRSAAERLLSHSPSERLVPLYLRRPDAVEPGPPKATLA